MRFETFVSGEYKRQFQYKSFSPVPVNVEWTWSDPAIHTLLEQASRSLAELDAFSLIVPDVDRFIRMHVMKEANTSSRIEGTRTEMDEALMERDVLPPERRDDWQEVQNYVDAMGSAIQELEELPLSSRLLRKTHETLMRGVRGETKDPGHFRTSQNWIGGSGPGDAVFVPPHHEEVPELMSDLEKFWHNETINVPHLIRVAISHYQFETIHPFLDGNGRIGRLLITLYLVSKGLLRKPSFYLSAHLEKHKTAYYDALTLVRTSNDISHWVKFFLTACIETARKGVNTFQAILALRSELEQTVLGLGARAQNAHRLLLHLYQKPMVSVLSVSTDLNISKPTANTLVREFESLGILVETTGFKRNRNYIFIKYFRLFLD